jgi:hypothetical protein
VCKGSRQISTLTSEEGVALAAWWVGQYIKLSFVVAGWKSCSFRKEWAEILLSLLGLRGVLRVGGKPLALSPHN